MSLSHAELYKDNWLLVVDKPSGLPTQSPRGGGDNLYARLRALHPYVGLHHRLDTPASGALLFSLDRGANPALAEAFREHRIHRRYRVVVLGDPGAGGQWTTPIEGRPAATNWRRLGERGGLSLLEVALETGRTHQIRIQAVEAGHPVIGDRQHGGAAARLWSRLALHAIRLDLKHPVTGKPLGVESPIPSDLSPLIEPIEEEA